MAAKEGGVQRLLGLGGERAIAEGSDAPDRDHALAAHAALEARFDELLARFKDIVAERDYLRIQSSERETALRAAQPRYDDVFARLGPLQAERDQLAIALRERDAELEALRHAHKGLVERFASLVAERDYLQIERGEQQAALHAARVKAEQALSRFGELEADRDSLAIALKHHQAELSAFQRGHLELTHHVSGLVAERNFVRAESAELEGKEKASAERARQLSERLARLEEEREAGLAAAERALGLTVVGGAASGAVKVLAPMKDGRRVQLSVPLAPFAKNPSCYISAYAKAGSVMLDGLVRDITVAVGAPAFNPTVQLFEQGCSFIDSDYDWTRLYAPRGVVHYGFRGYPPGGLPLEGDNPIVLLVRDPRDMLVSSYYSMVASHGVPTEGPQREELLRSRKMAGKLTVDEYCLRFAHGYQQEFERCRAHFDRATVFRYEDVIFQKHTFVANLCKIIGVSLPRDEIDRIAQAHDVRPKTEDVSAHVRKVTPGDHRNKLKPETIDALNGVFAEFMTYYGYDAGATRAAT